MVETTSRKPSGHHSPMRSWQFWLGLAVSLACLALALRDVKLDQVARVISQVNGWWLVLAIFSVLATFVIKAMRWQMLFSTDKRPGFRKAFTFQGIGMLLNTFAPARFGDLARAYLMGEAEEESKFYVLGTVAIEKLLDLVFLVVILLVLLTQIALPGWLVSSSQRLSLGIMVGLVLVGFLIWKGDRLINWGSRLFVFIPRQWADWLVKKAHLGLQSLQVFRQPGQLSWVLVWSLASWIMAALTNLLTFASIGLQAPFWASILLLVVLQAGVAVPSSPGRIGVFHYLTLITLLFFSVEKGMALSCGVVLHLVVVGPVGLVGMACLWWEKVTWNKLAEMASLLKPLVKKAE
jgi:glycosyltransferase 2 family protein